MMRGKTRIGRLVTALATTAGALALAPAAQAAVTLGPATQTVAESAGTVTFTVTRGLGLAATTAKVTLSTTGGSGCPAGVTPCSVDVSIAALTGTTAPAAFTITNDALDEPDQSITATITATSDMIGTPASAVAVITDDDPTPSVTVGAGSGAEGTAAAATTLGIPLTLSAVSGQAVTVGYDLSAGTATADDLTLGAGTVTIPAGQKTGAIPAQVVADALDEDDEAFTATLTSAGNATLGAAKTATATITDDDTAALAVGDAFGAEGTSNTALTFPVTLSTPSSKAVTVNYGTSDMSATAPADYLAAGGTVTFAPGETSKEFRVTVVGDTVPEPNEVFGVGLGAPVNAGLAKATALGGILNDDVVSGAGGQTGTGGGSGGGVDGTGVDVAAPKGKLTKVTLKKPGTLRSSYTCPATEKSCKATITIFTVAAPRGKVKRLRREVKLGARTITVAGGKKGTLSLAISKATLKLLRQAKRTEVRAYAVVRDAQGNIGTAQSAGVVKP